MSVRKRYGHYYTDFRFKDKRIVKKVPGGVTDKRQAQEWENFLKYKYQRGEMGLLSQEDSALADLVKIYLDYCKTNKAKATYIRDERTIRTFLAISGLKKLSELTPMAIENYKRIRLDTRLPNVNHKPGRPSRPPKPISKRTINLEIKTIKAMLNKLVALKQIAQNPIKSVDKLPGPESRAIEYLDKPEVDALLNAARDSVFFPIFYTFLKTGMRKGEIINLEWSDVNFDRKRMRIINKENYSPKWYKERHIPFDEKLAEILRPLHRAGERYVFPTKRGCARENNLLREVKRIGRKAGIQKNVTLHMLRHTYTSHLVMAGVPLSSVRELLGHSDFKTTLRYAHLAPDHLSGAVEKLPF